MYETVLMRVRDLFSDKSRTKQDTLNDLNSLHGEIQTMIDCLEYDIQQEDV